MADPTEWVGRVIDGRYTVESLLGQGGMGVVVRARHKFTGAHVAVKMLRRELNLDAQLETRFLAEARAPNAIGHASIVQVLDAGRTPEGELYMVMELLAGQPMRLAVSRGLGAPAIRRVSLELLDALAAAHARGFVHRDLKPENVFLADPNASVKLLDFGIAKVLAGDLGAKASTAAGVVLGTLAYMAPEQLADAAGVDPRADLWALGVMVYEMLSGRLPYRANTIEHMFIKLAKEEPDPIRMWLPGVEPPIEAFLTRALSRDPRARFGSAIEMAGALAQLPLASPAPPPIPAPSGPMTVATGFGPTGFPSSSQGLPPAGARTPSPALSISANTQAPRDSSRTIGLVLAGLAAVAIIIAIVVATRGGSDAPKGGRTDLAKVENTREPAPEPRPSVEPPEPAPAPTPRPTADHAASKPAEHHAATTTPEHAAPAPAVDICEQGCRFAAGCNLVSPTCLADCRRTKGFGGCFPDHESNCNDVAQCLMGSVCGAITIGTGTCAAAWGCQVASCQPGDVSCGCRCLGGIRYSDMAKIFAIDLCVAVCNYNGPCIQSRCSAYVDRCSAP